MDGAQVGILKETHQVSLGSFLECHHSRGLEAEVGLEILSDLTHQALERQLPDEQFGALLVTADLTESHGARPVAVGLLDTSRGRGRLASSLGSELLAGRLATSGLAGGLLGTCHAAADRTGRSTDGYYLVESARSAQTSLYIRLGGASAALSLATNGTGGWLAVRLTPTLSVG